MPAAKLSLDFDTRKFSDYSGTVLTAFSGKQNSIREYELTIQQGGVAMTFDPATTLTVALKKTTDPAGALLTSAVGTQVGWGSGMRWKFTLDLTGVNFAPVLGLTVDFDIMLILPDGQQFMSLTLPFKVEKAVQTP